MPLLKGALKEATNRNNYRAIWISALLLKILDNVILILYGSDLASDDLQFGYKKKTSGTQCAWMALEVKAAFFDCTKAFDKWLFLTLFSKLLDRGVPPIFVCVLFHIYIYQLCWVRWSQNQTISKEFGVSNSTRQASSLSPCLFAVYLDELLQELQNSGVGCYISGLFMGEGCFADDFEILGAGHLFIICASLHKCNEGNVPLSNCTPDPVTALGAPIIIIIIVNYIPFGKNFWRLTYCNKRLFKCIVI